MTYEEFLSLPVGDGWEDGRGVYMWERFDATLDPERQLRAEVTWNDNAECDDLGKPTEVYDPILLLETNVAIKGEAWSTWDSVELSLTEEEAVRLVTSPAHEILDKYADEISKLEVNPGEMTRADYDRRCKELGWH